MLSCVKIKITEDEMDIGIKSQEGTFKLRSCGVIVKNGKMLVDRARNFDGYVYLGGHINLGENSKDAR